MLFFKKISPGSISYSINYDAGFLHCINISGNSTDRKQEKTGLFTKQPLSPMTYIIKTDEDHH
jgi:hypothetical protein